LKQITLSPCIREDQITCTTCRHCVSNATKERQIQKESGMADNVNHPSHYMTGGIETLAFIKAKLTPEEYRGYLKGNILKYLSRAKYKGKEQEDISKSSFYMSELMKGVEDERAANCGTGTPHSDGSRRLPSEQGSDR